MKYTHIYVKLFIITALFLTLFVGGLLLSQMQYFGKYYTEQKKAGFFSTMESTLDDLHGKQFSQQELQTYLSDLKRNEGISALLLYPVDLVSQDDYMTDLMKQSSARDVSTGDALTANEIAINIMLEMLNAAKFPEQSSGQATATQGSEFQYISFSRELTINDSPYLLVAVASLQPVDEAVRTLSTSSWLVFTTAALCSLLLSAIISRLVARPLIREIEHEKELDMRRREFIAHASHELKTPLSIISSYSESLLDNIVSGDERREYEQIVFDETQKMDKLVRDMLEISWIQDDQIKLRKTEIRLDALIEKTLHRFSGLIKEKEIALSLEGNIPMTICADENQIEIVLDNLISNALFHTSPGGNVWIRLAKLHHGVRLEIENEGSPISEETINRIWDSFFRADKAHHREDGRYGLGLSIVKASIEKHGGKVGVQNTSNGVKFFFELFDQ